MKIYASELTLLLGERIRVKSQMIIQRSGKILMIFLIYET